MRWLVLLLCFSIAHAAVADLDVLRDTSAGFARAVEPRAFEFPRDHGPHPDFHHEWWYVTANLYSDTGERFGFELTIFRIGLVPPQVAIPTGSAWRTRELYAAHFAITDVARGTFEFSDQYSRGALGLAGAQAQPFHVWLNDWELGSTIHARGQGYELTLDTGSLGEPVLNGDRGLSRKSAQSGAASYYYSIPRITVRGKLVRDGVPLNVHGLAWLDREWGSGSLGTQQQGWDWFAFQLQDGSALMFYSLRNRDGSRDPNSAGTWIDAGGHGRPLAADQVVIDVSDHWTSPRGGRYPSRWRVRVPSVGLDVEVRPVLADQELGTRPRYWEGAVDLRGTQSGGDIAGRGYVELVGYGE
jgi:predicted secreted hydrolase